MGLVVVGEVDLEGHLGDRGGIYIQGGRGGKPRNIGKTAAFLNIEGKKILLTRCGPVEGGVDLTLLHPAVEEQAVQPGHVLRMQENKAGIGNNIAKPTMIFA